MTAGDKNLMKTDSVVSYHDFLRNTQGCRLTLQLALEHGLTAEKCLRDTGLTEATLEDAAAQIRMAQEVELTRNVVAALRHVPALGLEAGLRYSLSTFGIWGFAMLASTRFRAALDIAMRYHPLTWAFSPVTVAVVDGERRMIFSEHEIPEDLRPFCAERGLASTVRITRELAGKPMPMKGLRVCAPRPAHAERFAQVCGAMPRFGAKDNSFIIDDEWLDTPIVFGNPIVARQVEDQCRALLESRRHREGVARQVRDAILHNPTAIPSMETIAGLLHVTTRTLRRRLDDEGTSYRELVEEVRQTLAHELLKKAGMKMEEVAERLGYSDATSFAHAFRRWKGHSPSELR
jgi:AraC-like DNA-binding protein